MDIEGDGIYSVKHFVPGLCRSRCAAGGGAAPKRFVAGMGRPGLQHGRGPPRSQRRTRTPRRAAQRAAGRRAKPCDGRGGVGGWLNLSPPPPGRWGLGGPSQIHCEILYTWPNVYTHIHTHTWNASGHCHGEITHTASKKKTPPIVFGIRNQPLRFGFSDGTSVQILGVQTQKHPPSSRRISHASNLRLWSPWETIRGLLKTHARHPGLQPKAKKCSIWRWRSIPSRTATALLRILKIGHCPQAFGHEF